MWLKEDEQVFFLFFTYILIHFLIISNKYAETKYIGLFKNNLLSLNLFGTYMPSKRSK